MEVFCCDVHHSQFSTSLCHLVSNPARTSLISSPLLFLITFTKVHGDKRVAKVGEGLRSFITTIASLVPNPLLFLVSIASTIIHRNEREANTQNWVRIVHRMNVTMKVLLPQGERQGLPVGGEREASYVVCLCLFCGVKITLISMYKLVLTSFYDSVCFVVSLRGGRRNY